MKIGFYPRLAADGMRKNKRLYLPYILTCTGMVMMYYIVTFLQYSNAVSALPGGATITAMMGLGSWIIAAFAVLFLFYTNSFLIRRRKRNSDFTISSAWARRISVSSSSLRRL